jgi:hypothetical protein
MQSPSKESFWGFVTDEPVRNKIVALPWESKFLKRVPAGSAKEQCVKTKKEAAPERPL